PRSQAFPRIVGIPQQGLQERHAQRCGHEQPVLRAGRSRSLRRALAGNYMERELIHLPTQTRPILSVVVHTEEEFDWSKPHDRSATTVEHMRYIDRAQGVFDEHAIVPNYVVDYPIASQDMSIRPLKSFADAGRALIGAHLHPWVSPPHVEDVNARNSYPGNLPRALESEKLGRLTEKIAESFGTRPQTYLAGRYGFGANTAAILEELGYEVDISPAVPIAFSGDR